MSKKIMMTVRDVKAEAFTQPWFVRAEGEGVREFTKLCNDPDHPVGQQPEDYILYKTGEWDELTGKTTAEEEPVSVISGTSVAVA
jgi:hypothetical protein